MFKKSIALVLTIASLNAFSGEVFKIEIGKDYTRYSDQDLKRRVWELERAVWQLQQKVFELQATKVQAESSATWVCKTTAMGTPYTGIGGSKAVAENNVMEKCKADPSSDGGFFCKKPECTQ
jgi:hypothetical protein